MGRGRSRRGKSGNRRRPLRPNIPSRNSSVEDSDSDDGNSCDTTRSGNNQYNNHNGEAVKSKNLVSDINNEILNVVETNLIGPMKTEITRDIALPIKKVGGQMTTFLKDHPRVRTTLAVAAGAYFIYKKLPKQFTDLKDAYTRRFSTRVKVSQYSDNYPPLMQFINEQGSPNTDDFVAKSREDLKSEWSNNYWPSESASDGDPSDSIPDISILPDQDDGHENFSQTFVCNGKSFWGTKTKNGDGVLIWYMKRNSKKTILKMLRTVKEDAVRKKKARKIQFYQAEMGEEGVRWVESKKPPECRSIDCVVLGPGLKESLLKEVTDYLEPETKEWYKDMALPQRMGMLFYGPPGTGKTSLTETLASHYSLNYRELSLSMPGLTDAGLRKLFGSLERGDIVVLEDVDCAGVSLQRERQTHTKTNECVDSETETEKSCEEDSDDSSDTDSEEYRTPVESKSKVSVASESVSSRGLDGQKLSRKLKDSSKKKKIPKTLTKSTVTLAGLLGCIDGPMAPKGHILVMTSNHPEKLDEALTRAGRVNLKIKLVYACEIQLRDIFTMFYRAPRSGKTPAFDLASVPALARSFSKIVPAKAFTPAEIIHEFLITYRLEPGKALENAPAWIKANKYKLKDRGIPIPDWTELTKMSIVIKVSQKSQESSTDCGGEHQQGTVPRVQPISMSLHQQEDSIQPLVTGCSTDSLAVNFREPKRNEIEPEPVYSSECVPEDGASAQILTLLQPQPEPDVELGYESKRQDATIENQRQGWLGTFIDVILGDLPEGV